MTEDGYDPLSFGEVRLNQDARPPEAAEPVTDPEHPEDLLFGEAPDTAPATPMTDMDPSQLPTPAPRAPGPDMSGPDSGPVNSWDPLVEPEKGVSPSGVRRLDTLFEAESTPLTEATTQPATTPTADPGAIDGDRPHHNPLPTHEPLDRSTAAPVDAAAMHKSEIRPVDRMSERDRPVGRMSERDRLLDRPTRRQPLPRSEDRPARPVLPEQQVRKGPRLVPLSILLVGLGAAAWFCLGAENYPVAIFLALASIVGAPLVHMILQGLKDD